MIDDKIKKDTGHPSIHSEPMPPVRPLIGTPRLQLYRPISMSVLFANYHYFTSSKLPIHASKQGKYYLPLKKQDSPKILKEHMQNKKKSNRTLQAKTTRAGNSRGQRIQLKLADSDSNLVFQSCKLLPWN